MHDSIAENHEYMLMQIHLYTGKRFKGEEINDNGGSGSRGKKKILIIL